MKYELTDKLTGNHFNQSKKGFTMQDKVKSNGSIIWESLWQRKERQMQYYAKEKKQKDTVSQFCALRIGANR